MVKVVKVKLKPPCSKVKTRDQFEKDKTFISVIKTLWSIGFLMPVLRIQRPFGFFNLEYKVEKMLALGSGELKLAKFPTLYTLARRKMVSVLWVGFLKHQTMESCDAYCLSDYIKNVYFSLPFPVFRNLVVMLTSHFRDDWFKLFWFFVQKLVNVNNVGILTAAMNLIILDVKHIRKSDNFFTKRGHFNIIVSRAMKKVKIRDCFEFNALSKEEIDELHDMFYSYMKNMHYHEFPYKMMRMK